MFLFTYLIKNRNENHTGGVRLTANPELLQLTALNASAAAGVQQQQMLPSVRQCALESIFMSHLSEVILYNRFNAQYRL